MDVPPFFLYAKDSLSHVLEIALVSYPHLLHVGRTVPEQPFFDHHAVLPMSHGAHIKGKLLARGLDELPVPDRHGLGKVSRS